MNFIEIDISQLALLQQEESTIIIDVRERHEVPALDSDSYKKVPMSEFNDFLQTPIVAKNVVFLCQHGIRSVAAAEAFQEKYGNVKKIYNLKGGIIKWREYFVSKNNSIPR